MTFAVGRVDVFLIMKRFVLILITVALFERAPAATFAEAQPAAFHADELETFFDEFVPSQMNALHVPGAAVSVVRDGRIVFARGYGFADIEAEKLVQADKTLFRVASVSKLFVWTAVMQLVEDGQLDLDADINIYLRDFKIPAAYSQPITLLDLMNHTPGFEERALGTSARDPQYILPLDEFLAKHMPARVRPPGELTAYSNYGAALAGHIVEQVSGMPFEEYVEERIFKPLEMQRSAFRQPPPVELAQDLAIGYAFKNDVYEARDFEWSQLSPAAGLSATATDMANFMIAHLQNGRFNDARILQESTAIEMHRRSFTNDPRVNGFAHGFAEATINGQRVIGHTGDHLYFHSGLFLLPERQTGFFVSFNGANGMLAVLNTLGAVMDHFYPGRSVPSEPLNSNGNTAPYAGTYFPSRAEYTTAGKMVRLFQGINVTPAGPRELAISIGFPAQLSGHYVETEPGVFRSTDMPVSIFGDVVFRSEDDRRYLFQQNNPTTAYVKTPWYATPRLQSGSHRRDRFTFSVGGRFIPGKLADSTTAP